MAQHLISASALIEAPASEVYAIIADYHEGHPRILPKPPFVALEVDKGGVGAGTEIMCQMRMLGRIQTFHAAITEPEPGRVLVETIRESGMVTTYVVEPRNEGQQAFVTIRTEAAARGGILGGLEGWLMSRLLQPVYVKELEQLAAVAVKQAVGKQ